LLHGGFSQGDFYHLLHFVLEDRSELNVVENHAKRLKRVSFDGEV